MTLIFMKFFFAGGLFENVCKRKRHFAKATVRHYNLSIFLNTEHLYNDFEIIKKHKIDAALNYEIINEKFKFTG